MLSLRLQKERKGLNVQHIQKLKKAIQQNKSNMTGSSLSLAQSPEEKKAREHKSRSNRRKSHLKGSCPVPVYDDQPAAQISQAKLSSLLKPHDGLVATENGLSSSQSDGPRSSIKVAESKSSLNLFREETIEPPHFGKNVDGRLQMEKDSMRPILQNVAPEEMERPKTGRKAAPAQHYESNTFSMLDDTTSINELPRSSKKVDKNKLVQTVHLAEFYEKPMPLKQSSKKVPVSKLVQGQDGLIPAEDENVKPVSRRLQYQHNIQSPSVPEKQTIVSKPIPAQVQSINMALALSSSNAENMDLGSGRLSSRGNKKNESTVFSEEHNKIPTPVVRPSTAARQQDLSSKIAF